MLLALLSKRRFLPLFLVQATGGLNDNLFKNAMIVLVIFRAASGSGAGSGGSQAGAGLAAAAGGLFILPYALLSATAGQLADRYDKGRLIRWNKVTEVALMALGGWALMAASTPGLLAVLFGLGVQATLFGPLKYGILPQHLARQELLAGNALIEAATFGVILVGTILGGLLIGGAQGPLVVGVLGVVLSLLGLAAAWFIPAAPGSAGIRVQSNIMRATWQVVRTARASAPVWRAVLGLSWFWALGATYLALFPVLVRDVFHADNRVVTVLLAGFALGIGLGAMLGSRLLRGAVTVRLVAPAGLALSVCTIGFAALSTTQAAAGWTTPAAMLQSPAGLSAWLLLLGAAVAGGVFSLPLNTVIQSHAAPDERSRMVAANNVMNALTMVAGAGVIAALSAAGVGAAAMLLGAAVLNLGVAWWFRNGARLD